jgi:nucleoside-diphosphate-sugar epimerase
MIMEITGITIPVTFGPPASGQVRDFLADIARARDVFGYNPQYTVKTHHKGTIS